MKKTVYTSRSGSKYEQDDNGFLLRNGKREWFDDGKTFLYAGMVEKERLDFWGYLRVHDVNLSNFKQPRKYIKDGLYLLGITPEKLEKLKKESGKDNINNIYKFLHNQDPVQDYPHNVITSCIEDYI